MMISRSIVLFLMIFLASFSFTKENESFLPKAFKADFFSVVKSEVSGKVKKEKGVLYYQYPSHIRMEAGKGSDLTVFVSSPFKTWYYKAPFFKDSPGELTITETKSFPLSSFFDSLRFGLTNNKAYQVKKIKEDYEIRFLDKLKKESGVKTATLSFIKGEDFKNLKSVILRFEDEKVMTYELSSLEPKKTSFETEVFKFKVPKNTRINK